MKTSEAIFMWDAGGLNVLIPKQRGEGFLRVPYGHHNDPSINRIGDAVGADLCGLDGYLNFEFPKMGNLTPGQRDALANKTLPLLGKRFKFNTWREDRNAFWAVLLPGK